MTQPILLDTNALLWILGSDPKLSKRVRAAVLSPLSDIRVSVVNAWEIVLKFQTGKLTFDVPIERVLSEILSGATWPVLAVRPEHIAELLELPPIHRDPFDRMLVAQARAEGMSLATPDSQIRQYEVSTIW
ncbi:MAG TPA: type II toxin-antitoxin system VapC family toxin [Bryobacteraceae bacterium]|nr:type II toxin-antitoxin system VapC family toxin [Bryobacteraceae bacterium]